MLSITRFQKILTGLFNNLCLSQVKEQLSENLLYDNASPESFVCKGELFLFTDHRLIIENGSDRFGSFLN